MDNLKAIGEKLDALAAKVELDKTRRQIATLEAEAATAEQYHAEAAKAELASGYDIDKTLERKYWEGYADGVNNAIHLLFGMDANNE